MRCSRGEIVPRGVSNPTRVPDSCNIALPGAWTARRFRNGHPGSGDLCLLAEGERCAALRAAVVARALPEVVLARERRMGAGPRTTHLLKGDGLLALHRSTLESAGECAGEPESYHVPGRQLTPKFRRAAGGASGGPPAMWQAGVLPYAPRPRRPHRHVRHRPARVPRATRNPSVSQSAPRATSAPRRRRRARRRRPPDRRSRPRCGGGGPRRERSDEFRSGQASRWASETGCARPAVSSPDHRSRAHHHPGSAP